MTLEELLKAWNAAKAKADTNPTDKESQVAAAKAKEAYDEAKAKADGGTGDPDPVEPEDEFDENSADEKTKKYLAKLRKENAGHRGKAKVLKDQLEAETARKNAILKAAGIETDTENVEDKLKRSEEGKNQLAFRSAILESAIENGISGRDKVDYYEFLVTKATGELGDGEELSEESLKEIVARVNKLGGIGKGANSTVTKPSGKEGEEKETPAPADKGNDKVTLDDFLRMGVIAKCKLYEKNPGMYAQLKAEAKSKGRSIAS